MLIDCPICHDKHSVPDNYDNTEVICMRGKIFQDMEPTDILSRNEFNKNRYGTKVDENRKVTVQTDGPSFRTTGEKIGQNKTNY